MAERRHVSAVNVRPRPVPPEIEGPLAEDERWVVLHLRGHLHFGPACRLCRAESRAIEAERRFDQVVSG